MSSQDHRSARLSHPSQIGTRESPPESAQDRKRQNRISNRAKTHYQNTRTRQKAKLFADLPGQMSHNTVKLLERNPLDGTVRFLKAMP